jgi:parallel beta-helix repeat protein
MGENYFNKKIWVVIVLSFLIILNIVGLVNTNVNAENELNSNINSTDIDFHSLSNEHPPKITSSNVQFAYVYERYLIVYEAMDVDTSKYKLSWSLKTNATWVVLTGYPSLLGTPGKSDVGTYWLNITVSDGDFSDSTNFTLRVVNRRGDVINLRTNKKYVWIQNAVYSANKGDTIFISNGTYHERIRINKSINLTGESRDSTIINGTSSEAEWDWWWDHDPVIFVDSDWVNVSNLTINPWWGCDVGIEMYGSEFCRITNNKIQKQSYGINNSNNNNITKNLLIDNYIGINVYYKANKNSITHNIILNSSSSGIYFRRSKNQYISNNMFTKSGISFYLEYYPNNNLLEYYNTNNIPPNNKLNGKTIYYISNSKNKNYKNTQVGQLFIINSTNITFDNFQINDTKPGILIFYSDYVTINGSDIDSITQHGIYLLYSSNCTISNNNISNIPYYYAGIVLAYSSQNFISRNILKSNDGGLSLNYNSNNNIITQNYFIFNDGGFGICNGVNNKVLYNTFTRNNRGVLLVYQKYNNNNFRFGNNSVYNNNFINNTQQAFDSHGPNFWNSTYPIGGNYWSDYTGVDNKKGKNQDQTGNDSIGDSPYSNITGNANAKDNYPLMKPINIGKIPAIKPMAIDDLYALSGDGYVNLTWNKSDWDGGAPVTNYRIYRGTHPYKNSFLKEIGNVLFYNDTNVTNDVIYHYQVTAKNSVGEGPLSNDVGARPHPKRVKEVPTCPRNLGSEVGDSFVFLHWYIPEFHGNSTITNYRIYRATSPSLKIAYKDVKGGKYYFNDTNVTNSITYYYRVSAINSIGEGPLSSEISATPKYIPNNFTKVPTNPRNLSGRSGNRFICLSWNAPLFDGNSSILNYSIYRGTSSFNKSVIRLTGNILQFNDTTVTNGITYYYEVSAINSLGEGPRSNEVIAKPNYSQGVSNKSIPSHPLNLKVKAGDGYVYITWSKPQFNGNSSIINYIVYRGNKSGVLSIHKTIGNMLYFNDTNVNHGVTYYFRISAKNSVGEGPLSNEISATPKKPSEKPKIIKTVPTNPRELEVTSGDGFVDLKWLQPSFDGNSSITNYKLYRGTSSSKKGLLIKLGKVLTFNDTNVTNNITYFYEVSAINSIGESLRSNEAIATPFNSSIQNAQIQIPPTHPRYLTARAGDGFVRLYWDPPAYNGTSSIINYIIYRSNNSSKIIFYKKIGLNSNFNDTNVTNNITYHYRISALNKFGEGALSMEVSATPRPPNPNKKIKIIIDTDNDGIPDFWELMYGLNITNPTDAAQDQDNDNLTNLQEFQYNTNPKSNDTDNDNLTDWEEIFKYNTNATNQDSDGDGYTDDIEINSNTDPLDENNYPGSKTGDDKPNPELNLAFVLSVILIVIILTLLLVYLIARHRRSKEEI